MLLGDIQKHTALAAADHDASGQWHKITPSQELSDMLMEALNINGEEDNL